MHQVPLFINGEFTQSSSTQLIDVINPANQEVLAQVPRTTDAEMDASDQRDPAPVDMTPWEHAKNVSYGIMASTVGIYFLLTLASN